MTDFMEQGILIGIIATGIRLAIPYLLAALGEMFTQRSGVYNLGLEGIMLMGAFFGFFVTFVTHSPMLGILAAIVAGAINSKASLKRWVTLMESGSGEGGHMTPTSISPASSAVRMELLVL